ncbi:MAG: esterase, partial [Anaerolineales bacterium]|nr:esterase [Anaerolineales bacterium]
EDPGSVIWDLVRDGNPRPIKTWMEAGRYDIAPLIPGNRRMHELLVARGYDVAYREYDAGHNYSPPRPDD